MTFRFSMAASAAFVILSASAQASVILIDSQAGLSNSVSPATVAITPHPLWQQNNPVNPMDVTDTSAIWISYAATGYSDPVFQPYNGTTPVASVFHSFTSGDGYLTLHVWADDTAEVLLDGVSLFAPIFAQSTCSGAPIGCLPEHVGVINANLVAGTHQLEFKMFQVGTGTDTSSNPFGLLYTGGAFSRDDPGTPTPEPGTFAIGGAALAVSFGMRKWNQRRGARRMTPVATIGG